MRRDRPEITVVIPTFRRPALLARTVESVRRQTYDALRICIYDNASGDGTRDVALKLVAEDPRVSYHEHARNLGPTANFQFGLAHVDTPFWAFLSDDDVLLPDCYAAAMRGFADHPDAILSATQVVNEDESGRLVGETSRGRVGVHHPPDGLLDALRDGMPIWTGTVWRREVRDVVGDLRDDAGGAQDSDYQIRTAARCAYVVRPEIGAVFSSRSVRHEGAVRPFEFFWPNQFATVETLRAEPSLSPGVRETAARLLEDALSAYLFREALRYVYWRRPDDARRCLALLREKPRNGRRAALLALLLGSARMRPFAAAFRGAIDLRMRRSARRSAESSLREELVRSWWMAPGA